MLRKTRHPGSRPMKMTAAAAHEPGLPHPYGSVIRPTLGRNRQAA
jgi:hypothetical protein